MLKTEYCENTTSSYSVKFLEKYLQRGSQHYLNLKRPNLLLRCCPAYNQKDIQKIETILKTLIFSYYITQNYSVSKTMN